MHLLPRSPHAGCVRRRDFGDEGPILAHPPRSGRRQPGMRQGLAVAARPRRHTDWALSVSVRKSAVLW